MFVRDLLLIELRSDILRRLQRFLHLLRKFIRTHTSPYSSHVSRQLDLSLVVHPGSGGRLANAFEVPNRREEDPNSFGMSRWPRRSLVPDGFEVDLVSRLTPTDANLPISLPYRPETSSIRFDVTNPPLTLHVGKTEADVCTLRLLVAGADVVLHVTTSKTIKDIGTIFKNQIQTVTNSIFDGICYYTGQVVSVEITPVILDPPWLLSFQNRSEGIAQDALRADLPQDIFFDLAVSSIHLRSALADLREGVRLPTIPVSPHTAQWRRPCSPLSRLQMAPSRLGSASVHPSTSPKHISKA
jgi:hypothetical protein